MKALLALLLCVVPMGLNAKTLTCQSHDFCDSRLACGADLVDLQLVITDDGFAEFSYVTDMKYRAAGEKHNGFTTWTVQEPDAAITLTLTDGLEAAMSFSGVDEGKIFAGFQLLTCRAVI